MGMSTPNRTPDQAHQLLVRSRVDIDALEQLYHLLAPDVLRWFCARVADREVGRDLLAETFAQVIGGAARYRGGGDAAAAGWVWGIARNLLRSYYRRQRVESAARAKLGVLAAESASIGSASPRNMEGVGELLHAALDDLPTATRECVWLRLVEELGYEEIASRLGCSPPAARQRVSRGLRHLAVAMGEMQSTTAG